MTELQPSLDRCSIPSVEDFKSATKSCPLHWDALENFKISPKQSQESYLEQRSAIENCVDAINEYINVFESKGKFVKCRVTHGAPGSGKSFIMQYSTLYAVSCGLKVATTAMMSCRAIHLGGQHVHKLFCINTKRDVSIQRKAELATLKLMQDTVKMNILLMTDVLFIEEVGQMSADLLSLLDLIIQNVRGNGIFMGGILLICTMDHSQLQPVNGRPFLVSSHIPSCFQMTKFEHSVCTSEPDLQRLLQIARMHPRQYQRDCTLLPEFHQLCSTVFTYVPC